MKFTKILLLTALMGTPTDAKWRGPLRSNGMSMNPTEPAVDPEPDDDQIEPRAPTETGPTTTEPFDDTEPEDPTDCPEGEERCGGGRWWRGYCTPVCCDIMSEMTCFDDTHTATSCAPYAEGCPCNEGEVKCGGDENYSGYCIAVCCDMKTEETCYDDVSSKAESCAALADGGCPCDEGEKKCFADEANGFPGFCMPEDFCPWDYMSIDTQKDHMVKFIEANGTLKEISYFHQLEMMMMQKELTAHAGDIMQKKIALVRAIKLRKDNIFGNTEAVSVM